jgi:excisionase family DNA binding protein
MEQKLASVREAHQLLRIGRSTLYRMMDSGALETVKLGRRRLVLISSLERVASDGWTPEPR